LVEIEPSGPQQQATEFHLTWRIDLRGRTIPPFREGSWIQTYTEYDHERSRSVTLRRLGRTQRGVCIQPLQLCQLPERNSGAPRGDSRGNDGRVPRAVIKFVRPVDFLLPIGRGHNRCDLRLRHRVARRKKSARERCREGMPGVVCRDVRRPKAGRSSAKRSACATNHR